MEEIIKILKNVFIDNSLPLLVLTFGWIPLYYLKRLIDWVGPILLLRLPLSFKIRRWRNHHNLPGIREAFLTEGIPSDLDVFKNREPLLSFLSAIDAKISLMLLNPKSTAYILFPPHKVMNESKWIHNNRICLLESDLSLLESFSPDSNLRYTGVLNLASNPCVPHKESFDLLIRSLESSKTDLRLKIFFVAKPFITNTNELSKLQEIIINWSENDRKTVEDELIQIKGNLQPV